jgi:ribosomal-protein-alanine N-acetyltransferase
MVTMPDQNASAGTDVLSRYPLSVDQTVCSTDWRRQLPLLRGRGVTLRELRLSDASSLCALLTTTEVARFISPPPTTVEGFERFIAWTHGQRTAGHYACFAVVPDGVNTAIGIFQLGELDSRFGKAVWGFALGSPFWGTGLFAEGASLALQFAFEEVGVHRLEARAAIKNGRGNGALEKIGAVREAVLRRSFHKDGEYLDQNLWTILREDWHGSAAGSGGRTNTTRH